MMEVRSPASFQQFPPVALYMYRVATWPFCICSSRIVIMRPCCSFKYSAVLTSSSVVNDAVISLCLPQRKPALQKTRFRHEGGQVVNVESGSCHGFQLSDIVHLRRNLVFQRTGFVWHNFSCHLGRQTGAVNEYIVRHVCSEQRRRHFQKVCRLSRNQK
ncbi:hypothetical protein NEOLEDRAFT_258887 [Neolentinus lepideus HHB14362 ss-1]|uniref:Uncharacterized protein n=1 Tax=Neolentinus lepideus HHB14362 ss-1 TaxID=1314782 RepID=A0A165M8J4_9AGAM|nr:hypothetical protein NEOLEDRAFT_258887 [Neolentinus lepideus HHB14362 ss-1]